MIKEKFVGVRPSYELVALFSLISKEDTAQDMDRHSIFERAMRYVAQLEDKSILKKAAKEPVDEIDIGQMPTSLKVKYDEVLFDEVLSIFREVFQIEKVKVAFLMKVTLMTYLLHVREGSPNRLIDLIKFPTNYKWDAFDWKQVYETSTHPDKVHLYEVSRMYLENVDQELNERLRETTNEQIQRISDYYNIHKHYPEKRGNFGKTNIVFISKVLAGLILGLSEMSEEREVEVALDYMKKEITKKATKSFEQTEKEAPGIDLTDHFWKNILEMPEEHIIAVEAHDPAQAATLRKYQKMAREAASNN